MAADGRPSLAEVLTAWRGIEWPEPASYISPGYLGGARNPAPRRTTFTDPEENPMSEPLDPNDAQNPDDTSGGADDAAVLQGDIATDSDDS